MITYPEMGLHEAWKPLFQAMADAGWEVNAVVKSPQEGETLVRRSQLDHVLQFAQGNEACFLSIFQESEWCGNQLQAAGLTVVGLTKDVPQNRMEAEEYSLVLTGDWKEAVSAFVRNFQKNVPKIQC